MEGRNLEKQPVIEMLGITKRFVDVTANDRVDLSLYPKEICALLGENGAGKTTLMNILFGYYLLDEGEILIHGEKVTFGSPKDAITHGIAMIHQHFTLVPIQTVLENVMIGVEGKFFLDKKSARKRLIEIEERFGLALGPDLLVWTLSIGEQQKLEILKALYREAEILIMDEPTAVLAPTEIEELFKTLRTLVDNGRSVIFISHKLHEVLEISNRIVVLRSGKNVAERKTSETNIPELANLMVGRELLERLKRKEIETGAAVLEVKGLRVRNSRGLIAVDGLDLTLRSGEVVGIAGVSGNGQTELSEALFGQIRPEEGILILGGEEFPGVKPSEVIRRGMARIPEDRIGTGLFMDLSVKENMVLENHVQEPFSRRGLTNMKEIRSFASGCIENFQVKTDGMEAPVKSLSGGNLQKVILARELAGNPKIVVACQPTRGLDVGAMEYIHQVMLKQKERGAGVLLISDDLDEIFLLSDRILVMYEGKILGEMNAEEANREQIGLWMSGVTS
ncbi:MAG: ABC transporter ATP-binding protein [Spirochaetales bacterium]|jgi:simple sugar transport system ATP-binding protein|nr:ABC transporter ATP-binding protein [Spirochaetales bacterium]